MAPVSRSSSDIVFNPNLAEDDSGPKGRWRNYLSHCRSGSGSWTSKKKAKSGDLYLFWFGNPVNLIGGIGIHDGDFYESDYWPNQGGFDPTLKLNHPVSLAEIRADPSLAGWWSGNPYRGGPKTILKRPEAALRLLEIIQRKNPSLSGLLEPYHRLASRRASAAPSKGRKATAEPEESLDAAETFEARILAAQGFQSDPRVRRVVELHAVRRARGHYEKLG